MDFITIIKDKLVYFTLFKRTSRLRKYLSLMSWLFLMIVPILDNEFFGNNIQQLNITTNITLTILLFITLKIYHFYQSSSNFILKCRNYTVGAANEMATKLANEIDEKDDSGVSGDSLNKFKNSIKNYIKMQKDEESWEKKQLRLFDEKLNIVSIISVALIFIIYVYNLVPMINSLLVFPTSGILTLLLLISKPTNRDIIHFYSSRREFSTTISAMEELSNIILETRAFENRDYPNTRKFFKFAISCNMIVKKKDEF